MPPSSTNTTKFPSLMTLPTVRQAIVICPLCILIIASIFWLKPATGGTVRGLALLTVGMQACSALFLIMAFRAAKSIREALDGRKTIQKITLSDKGLLDKAFIWGRYVPIDPHPNPMHITDWLDNNEIILRSVLVTFEEAHVIPPQLREEVYRAFHNGVSALLASQPEGNNSFALTKDEDQILVDQLFSRVGPL